MSKPDKGQHPEFVKVDGINYPWTMPTISGEQLRGIAPIPANVQIYQKVPGQPDRLIEMATVVDLTQHGVEQFSTQAPDSDAG